MPGPFFNAIKGSSSGTAGTGAFTPTTAPSGYLAWSNVPTGWIGLIRYEDGSSWELRYGYWNGTTISRPTNGFVASSSGSGLSLTSAAFAAMTADANEVCPHLGGACLRGAWALPNSTTTPTVLGLAALTITGTAAAAALATTNFLTEQVRHQANSATTANAQAGWSSVAQAVYSTSAGRGGFEFTSRFGAAQLPTGPRLFVGMTSTTFVGNAGEPSALTANVACFAKDSTDTNIQLLVNSNAGSGTKTDTGIPLTANGWYEATIWAHPGGGTIYGLLIRLDTGDIWYGSTTSDIPTNGALPLPNVIGGLSSTTGTAFQMCIQSMTVRAGT